MSSDPSATPLARASSFFMDAPETFATVSELVSLVFQFLDPKEVIQQQSLVCRKWRYPATQGRYPSFMRIMELRRNIRYFAGEHSTYDHYRGGMSLQEEVWVIILIIWLISIGGFSVWALTENSEDILANIIVSATTVLTYICLFYILKDRHPSSTIVPRCVLCLISFALVLVGTWTREVFSSSWATVSSKGHQVIHICFLVAGFLFFLLVTLLWLPLWLRARTGYFPRQLRAQVYQWSGEQVILTKRLAEEEGLRLGPAPRDTCIYRSWSKPTVAQEKKERREADRENQKNHQLLTANGNERE